jgi:nucleoside-diphosphate-sugar epimerase
MRVLVIGGSGFMGPFVVRRLLELGHEVAVVHRGHAPTPTGATAILGDRRELMPAEAPRLREFGAEIVIDLIMSSAADAANLLATFLGSARRTVVASSMDVYRAAGVLHGTELSAGPGKVQPVPLTEDSELRTKPLYSASRLKAMQAIMPWVDLQYDKVPAEKIIMDEPELPGTVLRLPAVYGPGDPLRRLWPVLKRIDDQRPAIILPEDLAAWRWSRGYVENVAEAFVLAATNDAAAGRVYNVCEPHACSSWEWAMQIADATGWKGQMVCLPRQQTPAHLRPEGNYAQDWVASSERIRRELGYEELVPLDEALQRAIRWERAHPPQNSIYAFDYAEEDKALKTMRGWQKAAN